MFGHLYLDAIAFVVFLNVINWLFFQDTHFGVIPLRKLFTEKKWDKICNIWEKIFYPLMFGTIFLAGLLEISGANDPNCPYCF